MHQNTWLCVLVSSLLFVGCTGSAQVRGSASVSTPELVYVSPGVQVIADYREPIFYSDRYYWRFDGHVWFRSTSYTSGWVRYQAPVAILRIERPSAYIHYRGSARASTAPQSAPAMTHEQRKDEHEAQKEERREIKAEQKEARQEQKEEQKEERKEQKEERKEAKKEAKKDRK